MEQLSEGGSGGIVTQRKRMSLRQHFHNGERAQFVFYISIFLAIKGSNKQQQQHYQKKKVAAAAAAAEKEVDC